MRRFLLLKRVSGSVFQTGLPFRQESEGLKTPRLLRDRPTDGAARACNFMRALCANGRRLWRGCGRFRGDGSARREVTAYARGTRGSGL